MPRDDDLLWNICRRCNLFWSWPHYQVDRCPNCGGPIVIDWDD